MSDVDADDLGEAEHVPGWVPAPAWWPWNEVLLLGSDLPVIPRPRRLILPGHQRS